VASLSARVCRNPVCRHYTDGTGKGTLVTVKWTSKAVASYVAVVERISAAGRQPTPWEAGCLFAALCALSVGDDAECERKVTLASLTGMKGDPPVTLVPVPTAEDLLRALQTVRGRFEESPDALAQSNRRPHARSVD
jgi:hypothetical protein